MKQNKTIWIVGILILLYLVYSPTDIKKEGTSYDNTLSDCVADRNEYIASGKSPCTPCVQITQEIMDCMNTGTDRLDKYAYQTQSFGECKDYFGGDATLQKCIRDLGVVESEAYKVTILDEFQLSSSGDIEVTRSSTNFDSNGNLRAFIYLKNNGDQSQTVLTELQPRPTLQTLSVVRQNTLCDDTCKENVHTLVQISPGQEQQVSISLPQLANGVYNIHVISFDSCCTDNPSCQAISPFYAQGDILAQIKVENSKVTERCGTAFCGDGLCNGKESSSSCSKDCGGTTEGCPSDKQKCSDGSCREDCGVVASGNDIFDILQTRYAGFPLWTLLLGGLVVLLMLSSPKK